MHCLRLAKKTPCLVLDKLFQALIVTPFEYGDLLVGDKNAVMIYASDHGESLGEGGKYGHISGDAPEQYHIPFIIWMSDTYIKNNPKKFDSVKANLKLNLENKMNFDYRNIFHTILDCASIEGAIIDKSKSLCEQKK
jgi:KDO II ethanolaminephosphotransferase